MDEPVIIPGAMMSSRMPRLNNAGIRRNLRMIQTAKASRKPVFCADFMKIMAEAMTMIVSR